MTTINRISLAVKAEKSKLLSSQKVSYLEVLKILNGLSDGEICFNQCGKCRPYEYIGNGYIRNAEVSYDYSFLFIKTCFKF